MASMSAREYKEWEAYERAYGPIDGGFERQMLRELHELLQLNNTLTGASLTKKGRKNPAGKFRRAPQPQLLTDPYFDPEDEAEEPVEDEEDFDEFDPDSVESFKKRRDPNEYDPSKDPFA